jgi:hypothetical protein
MDIKKVFISYSWSSELHQNWVISLANRLVQDGVDVKFDKWDLKEGHDKYSFMESMVKADDIDKVLIILDKKYTERADERKGGVGTETLIITPQVYENALQEKFIPIVCEVDENDKAFLPVYLAGKIYIDLSAPEHFEANYEKLLRSIFNRPSLSKPKIGSPPRYLFEDTPMHFKTSTMVKGLDEQLNKFPGRINAITRDFLDEFFSNLAEFKVERQANPTMVSVGEAVLDRLKQYMSLKSDYIHYFEKITKAQLNLDYDIVLHFLEKLPLLFAPQEENVSGWHRYEFGHYKLIANELFLYTVAIALKNADYKFLEEIFHSKYLMKERHSNGRGPNTFSAFYFHCDIVDEYYKNLKGVNYYSVQAELIITNIPEGFPREALIDGDLLAHYIAKLNGINWFPKIYVYRSDYNESFDFFNRLISIKHFEKVKNVLGVDNLNELKIKLTEIKENGKERGYDYGFSRMPELDSFIKAEQVGTAK